METKIPEKKNKSVLEADVTTLFKRNKSKKKQIRLNLNKKKLFNIPQKYISIDIGTKNIKVVVGKATKDKFRIEKFVMEPTPKETYADGVLSNAFLLNRAFNSILRRNGIKVKDANIVSNSTNIIYREIIVPVVKEKELMSMVKFELSKYLPINMDNYIVQYDILQQIVEEDVNKLRISAVIYPQKMSEQYLELLKNLKLNPNALDVNYNSIKKMLLTIRDIDGFVYNNNDSLLFLDMGASSLKVNIFTKGDFEFTRIIRGGGNDIDEKIAEAMKVSLEEAEKIKINDIDFNKINYESLLNPTVKASMDEWLEEIQRVINFYKNKKVGSSIDRIIIYGGTSKLKGLKEYMEKILNIRVIHLNSSKDILFDKYRNSIDVGYYVNAIGALKRI